MSNSPRSSQKLKSVPVEKPKSQARLPQPQVPPFPTPPEAYENISPVPLIQEVVQPNAPPANVGRKKARPPRISAATCTIPAPPLHLLEEKIEELIALQGEHPEQALIKDLIITALKLVRDGSSRGEVKIMAAAMRELRYAFKVFRPFQHKRKVTIFGSARTASNAPEYQAAKYFAEEMVKREYMVITGAGPGIMQAAQEGAGRDQSFGVNIRLPFEQASNPVIAGDPKLIHFRYFFTRKLCFVKEASAIALFPGGFGTHDEGFETLTLVQTGKASPIPIVFMDRPGGTYWREWASYVERHLLGKGLISKEDFSLFKITDDPDWAVEEILQFYKRYHSSRYVKDRLVLRMLTPISAKALAEINRRYASLLSNPNAKITSSGPLPEEADQPGLNDLPRLVVPFNRRNFGKLRQLIDDINIA